MIDFHTHVLPGVDDGSDSVETSLAMLELWKRQPRIDGICATPHFYADSDTPGRFLRRRREAWERLSSAMDGGPPIRLGAEVHFFEGIALSAETEKLCLEGTDLLLLEMPFAPWNDRVLRQVGDLIRRGIRPVAAHFERYFALNRKDALRRFMDMDVLIQCNADFFLERRTARKAMTFLKEGRVDLLGSDAHNASGRAPNLQNALVAIEAKLGPGPAAQIISNEKRLGLRT